MKRFTHYIYVLFAIVVMASCSSTRVTTTAPMVGGLTGKAYTEKVIESAPQWGALSGKAALNLNMGSKELKVNGTLRLKRGQSIQILITPLLGIEVARLEITPDGLLAIDRINKRYAQVSFSELSTRLHTQITFDVVQSLFLNEVFLPGKSGLHASDASSFLVSQDGTQACLDAKSSDNLTYRFLTSAAEGLLQETRIGMQGSSYVLSWKYDSFQALEQRQFPLHMLLTAEDGSQAASLDMKLSRLSVGGDWDATTSVTSKYRRIELSDVLKMLKSQSI